MLTIGLIGGMSWQSTAQYYRLANEIVHDRLGGYHSAQVLLYSVDFATIEALQIEDRWYDAGEVLVTAAKSLEAGGADLILICANTMHKAFDQVAAAVTVPLLHVADVTATAVQNAGVTTVGLLGTRYTMDQTFYRDRLASHGLDVLVPDDEDRALIHRVIYGELVHGVFNDSSRGEFVGLIDRLADRGAQGVILGCTEIELLISHKDTHLRVFPTTQIHIQAAVDQAIAAS
ncbi:MAG: aspartate/glutamate racemase family protein [Acidothermaceae bacterium]